MGETTGWDRFKKEIQESQGNKLDIPKVRRPTWWFCGYRFQTMTVHSWVIHCWSPKIWVPKNNKRKSFSECVIHWLCHNVVYLRFLVQLQTTRCKNRSETLFFFCPDRLWQFKETPWDCKIFDFLITVATRPTHATKSLSIEYVKMLYLCYNGIPEITAYKKMFPNSKDSSFSFCYSLSWLSS